MDVSSQRISKSRRCLDTPPQPHQGRDEEVARRGHRAIAISDLSRSRCVIFSMVLWFASGFASTNAWLCFRNLARPNTYLAEKAR